MQLRFHPIYFKRLLTFDSIFSGLIALIQLKWLAPVWSIRSINLKNLKVISNSIYPYEKMGDSMGVEYEKLILIS